MTPKGFTHELPVPKSMHWLTPKHIIDRLGPFDLDPCAAPEPRPWPTAAHHIIEAEDGLNRTWFGMVWLNPPYGRQIGAWMERLCQHRHGIALVFARTDTQWFGHAATLSGALLFLAGRVQFHLPDGTVPGRSSAPSVLMAFGKTATQRLRACGLDGVCI